MSDSQLVWAQLSSALQRGEGFAPETLALAWRCLLQASDDPRVWYGTGVACHWTGHHACAAELITHALQKAPGRADWWHALGQIHHAAGQESKAVLALRRSLEIAPDQGKVWCDLGVVLQASRTLVEAGEAFKRALKLDKTLVTAWSGLGVVLRDLQQTDQAEEILREAVRLQPDYAHGWNNLGILLLEKKEPKAAVDCFDRALALSPGNDRPWLNRGQALEDRGETGQAIASYRKALEINPQYAEARYALCGALFSGGNYSEAVEMAQAGCALMPEEALNWYSLASLELRLRNIEAAQHAIEQGLIAEKGRPEAKDCVKVLGAILCWVNNQPDRTKSLLEGIGDAWQQIAYLPEHRRFVGPYIQYLRALLQWRATHPERYRPAETIKQGETRPVVIIGESHALASAHLQSGLPWHEADVFTVIPEIIIGVKAWHLGNPDANPYKMSFQRILDTVSLDTPVLVVVGEIDCRKNEGIFRRYRKYGEDWQKAVEQTAANYMNWLVQQFSLRNLTDWAVVGVPAPNADLSDLSDEERASFLNMIEYWNICLRRLSVEHGKPFIDVWHITAGEDKFSHGAQHIDLHHLKPDALVGLLSE